MQNNHLQPLDENGTLPVEETLCVFKHKQTNVFLLGYLQYKNKISEIKAYGNDFVYSLNFFTHYHYILNEHGGFYFIKTKKK